MRSVWRILGVSYSEALFWIREWTWIAQSISYIAGFFLLFYIWGGLEALKGVMVASIIVGGWSIGANAVAQVVGWHKMSKRINVYVASPLTLAEYYAGMVLAQLPILVIELSMPLIVASLMRLDPVSLLLLYVLSIIALLLGSFLVLSVVLRIKNPANISAITNPIVTLTVMLPPVYYPAKALPEPYRYFMLIVPTTPLAEAARLIAGMGTPVVDAWVLILMIAAWLTASIVLLLKTFRWGLG
ncbi:ABC transporter permease [Infirmifilum uzonense]|uniref:ABC transporter permease n=2 Tax=Infirmifilum TaxID=2856573 RepID=UPI003C722F22